MKSLSIVLCLLAACDLASAKEVPLPRAKPLSAADPSSLVPVPEVLPLHDAEAWPSDCALRLAVIARFAHQPSLNGPGQCGASDVVRLEGIIMPNGAVVNVMPAATLRCPIAEAVAQWVRNDLGPAMAEFDSSPAAVSNHGSYDCRGRNYDPGAKISEHGARECTRSRSDQAHERRRDGSDQEIHPAISSPAPSGRCLPSLQYRAWAGIRFLSCQSHSRRPGRANTRL
jgi:Extensin-like protein C-terminus